MKKMFLLMLALIACATSLSAQITQEQADEIVLEYIQNEVAQPYFLYVNVKAPNPSGIALTTHNEESVKVKYACWAYYLNENPALSEPCQHRYLFVKADDGNLLEIITSNDLAPDNLLTQWTLVLLGVETWEETNILVYPNPTTGELTINNEQLIINNIEIFDIYGRKLSHISYPKSHISNLIDISDLAPGIYFVKIKTEINEIVKKVVKQ